MRLLLVDDDELLRWTLTTHLVDSGMEVDSTSCAEEALEDLSSKRYDVVLSDIQMPGMSGVELLKAVRQFDLDVPVILMTGDPSVDSAVQALEYGAFRYLRKPVAPAALDAVIGRASRYHALARLKRDAIGMAGGAAQWPADRAALEGRFDVALERLWVAFQPIVSFRERRIHAYETLLRSDEPTLGDPGAFLEAAEQLGRLPELSRAIRRKVGEALPYIHPDIRLFANVHPADLNDPELYARSGALAESSARIVVEVTERASLQIVDGLQRKLDDLRSLGFMLAVDDLGAGYAGLTSMAQLEPEYVKLDMSLIRDVDKRPTQQKLVRSIVNVCQELDKKVIAEGVEQWAECDALVDIGCDLLQGYLFARPERKPPLVVWD